MARKFQETTILAFYGSAVGSRQADTDRITRLVEQLTGFIGPNVGVLTGGGGGVMRLATDQARSKGALTGACFLELEAQPPELGVDFFNTFQESSRHFRQKWFEAADFCIFNVGGVGTLEEVGIELCNLKLGIRPRTPYVFFNSNFWGDLRKQVNDHDRHQARPGVDDRLPPLHRRPRRGRPLLPQERCRYCDRESPGVALRRDPSVSICVIRG
jgi:predicted Rossmann-fold nucleotide-binding protein